MNGYNDNFYDLNCKEIKDFSFQDNNLIGTDYIQVCSHRLDNKK